MPIIYKNGNIYGAGGGGGTAATTTFDDTNVEFEADDVQEAFEEITKTVTQAEYDALSTAEKNNGTIYLISDGTATNIVECTQATYPATPEQDTFYLISDAPSLQGTSADLLYESGSATTTKAKIDSKQDKISASYLIDGLSTPSGITRQNGGYTQIGNLIIVNVRLNCTNSVAAETDILSGLPAPMGMNNIVAVTFSKDTYGVLTTSGSIRVVGNALTSGVVLATTVYLTSIT